MLSRISVLFLVILGARFAWADTVLPRDVRSGPIFAFNRDDAGNTYVVGRFTGTMFDLNPFVGEDNRTSRLEDVYVTRFDADGSYAWTQTLGASGTDSAYAVALTASTIYVAGAFHGADFGVGAPGLLDASGANGFVVALSTADGAPITGFGENGVVALLGTGESYFSDVIVRETALASTLYLGGRLENSATLSSGGSFNAISGVDGFVLALDAATGTRVTGFSGDGMQLFGGAGEDRVVRLALGASTLYALGDFSSANAGIGTTGAVSADGTDVFVLALNVNNGAAVTSFSGDGVQVFGGNAVETAGDVELSGSRLYVAATFASTTGVHVGATALDASSAGSNDAGIIALSTSDGSLIDSFADNGLLQWGGTAQDTAAQLAVEGNALIFGAWSSSANATFVGMGDGAHASLGLDDSFVFMRDAQSGEAIDFFGPTGYLQVTSASYDRLTVLNVAGARIQLAFNSPSTTGLSSPGAALDGLGPWPTTGLSQSVVIELDGRTGAYLAAGPVGPTGAQGSAGAAGADGVFGATGAMGASGAPGAPGTDGAHGQDGNDGRSTLVATRAVLLTDCAYGGVEILAGVDADMNGVLDEAEIGSSTVVCQQPPRTDGCAQTGSASWWLWVACVLLTRRFRALLRFD